MQKILIQATLWGTWYLKCSKTKGYRASACCNLPRRLDSGIVPAERKVTYNMAKESK